MDTKFEFNFEHPHEPMEVISAWQEWSKHNRVVAEMNEPLVTKDSREYLHNTTNAVKTMSSEQWDDFFKRNKEMKAKETNLKYFDEAVEHFDDTLCEFQNELSGEQLFNCFYKAAKKQLDRITKEYDNAKDLVDMLEGKVRGKK